MHPRDKDRGLSLAKLRAILHYDPLTGDFISKVRRGPRRVGMIAGTPRTDGYIDIEIDGHLYLAHRLAWFYYFGVWPSDRIDHIKGRKNNIANLREATQQQNMFNFNGRKNKALPKGVFKCRDGRFEVCIRVKDKSIYLGRFKLEKTAEEIYQTAASLIHGTYANDASKINADFVPYVSAIIRAKLNPSYTPWTRLVFRTPQ